MTGPITVPFSPKFRTLNCLLGRRLTPTGFLLLERPKPVLTVIRQMAQAFAKKDVNLIVKRVHKCFCRVIHPRSIGTPDQSEEEWLRETERKLISSIIGLLSDNRIRDLPTSVIARHFKRVNK
jgi:hypothetical protein